MIVFIIFPLFANVRAEMSGSCGFIVHGGRAETGWPERAENAKRPENRAFCGIENF
jgi:hypothetical protein